MAASLLPLLLLSFAAAAVAADTVLTVDRSKTGQPLSAIGGLSGGGATSRLLIDYKEPQRSQVLDYLFKPNFGASLQLLKVEIGGDSQSTDGTETSHMHSADDLDYKRGYEWWLMAEAKKRNPDIKLYGLPWAYPGWVGEASGNPFQYPNLTASYVTKWVEGAKSVYGLDIDYIGIWNERSSDATYVKTLRRVLDTAGFQNTAIVARDGGSDICDDLAKDKEYSDAVSIIGLHYPSDYSNYDSCYKLNKPIWASEESSSYDDLNGAACWGRVITSHWVLSKFTASIMWNLVGSYFHGTNWYASSMFTAVQPWSGYYTVNPVVWASAHVTQFTKVGWLYLENGSGSGQLPQGGFYTTLVEPTSEDGDSGGFSIVIVKIDEDHAPCTRPGLPSFNVSAEDIVLKLDKNMGTFDSLAFWYSNFENYTADAPLFERQADIAVGSDGTIRLHVPVGAMITLSTLKQGPTKGSYGTPPPSSPSVPLPIVDDFQSYNESAEARWWSDQIGAFEIHAVEQGRKVMRQMVPALPIGWSDHGSQGPVTVVGMREWQDLNVAVSFRLPSNASGLLAGCVGSRLDQMSNDGIMLCVYTANNWTLSVGGPSQATGMPQPNNVIASGQLSGSGVTLGQWHNLSLTTVESQAVGAFDGVTLFHNQAIRNMDTGFAAFGTNVWVAIEFGSVSVTQAGSRWQPERSPCGDATVGTQLYSRNCSTNGLPVDDQAWELGSDWALRHIKSGLCAQAASKDAGATIALAQCDDTNVLQQFKNDYTRIRNTLTSVYLNDGSNKNVLTGTSLGPVGINQQSNNWSQWTYFPNTNQLRNQYTANTKLGYPQCLSACKP